MQDIINSDLDIPTDKQALLEYYLTRGCDERIYLNEDGLTRYWVNPTAYKGRVNRGSCTCGSLNDDNLNLMHELLDRNLTKPANYEQLLKEQTAELKHILNHPGEDKFEVFYGPSGTDLVYFPIIFANILHPNRPILNLLSCPEELGSGTLFAVRGEYHANNNQFEEAIPKGQKISPSFNIKVLYLDARGIDGKIINHEPYIGEQIKRHQNHSIVGSLVYGSKSGIQDNLNMIDRFDRNDIIWNVDLCQFRHHLSTIHRILDKNGVVMITGSKFYQAPPFCGAMLVSKKMMKKIKEGNFDILSKFSNVFSAYDFPESIREETGLEKRQNIGNLLRWACFLNERKKFSELSEEDVHQVVKRWNKFINTELEQSEEFELMPDQAHTNSSIISFRVKKDGEYLNHKELKELYRQLVCADYSDQYDFEKIFIGQPVAYGHKSFLRFAVGSMNLRKFHKNNEQKFEHDAQIIQILKDAIKAFKK